MPEYSLDSCRSILSDALKMPRGSDLSHFIQQFQGQLFGKNCGDGKGDRILTILLELAVDLNLYEPDPIAREENQMLMSELCALEKIKEALEALDNIERVMPWLKQN